MQVIKNVRWEDYEISYHDRKSVSVFFRVEKLVLRTLTVDIALRISDMVLQWRIAIRSWYGSVFKEEAIDDKWMAQFAE
jgi:hypothetical protein